MGLMASPDRGRLWLVVGSYSGQTPSHLHPIHTSRGNRNGEIEYESLGSHAVIGRLMSYKEGACVWWEEFGGGVKNQLMVDRHTTLIQLSQHVIVELQLEEEGP